MLIYLIIPIQNNYLLIIKEKYNTRTFFSFSFFSLFFNILIFKIFNKSLILYILNDYKIILYILI